MTSARAKKRTSKSTTIVVGWEIRQSCSGFCCDKYPPDPIMLNRPQYDACKSRVYKCLKIVRLITKWELPFRQGRGHGGHRGGWGRVIKDNAHLSPGRLQIGDYLTVQGVRSLRESLSLVQTLRRRNRFWTRLRSRTAMPNFIGHRPTRCGLPSRKGNKWRILSRRQSSCVALTYG